MTIPIRSLFAALAASAVLAGPAAASPAWVVGGSLLGGTETVRGLAIEGRFAFTGLTVTCEETEFEMTIHNLGGVGKGEITAFGFDECSTDSTACTVESIEAEDLPWPARLVTVGSNDYLVIEAVSVGILFGGEECVLNEYLVEIEGSAGGYYDNGGENAKFSPWSFTETGTELEAFGGGIEVESIAVFQFETGSTESLQVE